MLKLKKPQNLSVKSEGESEFKQKLAMGLSTFDLIGNK